LELRVGIRLQIADGAAEERAVASIRRHVL
jgi:hypothetical protein